MFAKSTLALLGAALVLLCLCPDRSWAKANEAPLPARVALQKPMT